MTITISDPVVIGANLDEPSILKELALALLPQRRISMGQARKIAGVDRLTFEDWMMERQNLHEYDIAAFEEDVKTLEKLGRLQPLP